MKNTTINQKRQSGQGIIIVALIAIAAIGVYSQFGKGVRGQMAGLTQELSGTTADISDATDAATKAKELAETDTNLGNYSETATSGTQ